MADEWYYAVDGQQRGPVSGGKLKQLAAAGEINKADLVWKEGMADWVKAEKVKGLFVTIAKAPPKPKPKPADDEYGFQNLDESEFPAEEAVEVPRERPRRSVRSSRPSNEDPAGFLRRLGAMIIDQIVLMFLGFVVGFVLGIVMFAAGARDPQSIQAAGNLLGLVLGWLYYASMESSSSQATWGKQALGIKVTDLDGNPISFARATGRHFGKILSALPLAIGFLLPLFTERKQALHDMIAGCVVVKSN